MPTLLHQRQGLSLEERLFALEARMSGSHLAKPAMEMPPWEQMLLEQQQSQQELHRQSKDIFEKLAVHEMELAHIKETLTTHLQWSSLMSPSEAKCSDAGATTKTWSKELSNTRAPADGKKDSHIVPAQTFPVVLAEHTVPALLSNTRAPADGKKDSHIVTTDNDTPAAESSHHDPHGSMTSAIRFSNSCDSHGLSGSSSGDIILGQTTRIHWQSSTYSLELSVWDAPIIVFTSNLSFGSSVYLALVALANVLVQAYLCLILLTDHQFRYNRKFDEMLFYGGRWRTQDAHDFRYACTEDMSLAARVCNLDDSLSIATAQVEWLYEINSYLSLDIDQLDNASYAHGPILSMMCVAIFVILIIEELRCATSLTVCLAILVDQKTKILDMRLISISRLRLICCWALCAIRIVIAFLLLYSGVCWISSTSSIEDLLLNAAALSFVMDIDEMLFTSLMPECVIKFVRELKPLAAPTMRHCFDGCLPMTFLVTILVGSFTRYIAPIKADMMNMKQVLCGGNLNFVINQNMDTNLVMSRETAYFQEPGPNSESLAGRAASELQTFTPDSIWWHNWSNVENSSSLSLWFGDYKALFNHWVDYKLEIPRYNVRCQDWDAFPGLSAWFNAVRELNIEDFGNYPLQKPFNCSDFVQDCKLEKNFALRLACPRTCGCDDFASGLYLTGQVRGCPPACARMADIKLKSSHCMDVNLNSSKEKASWVHYWQGWELFEKALNARTWSDVEDKFLKDVKTKGCIAAVDLLSPVKAGWEPCTQTQTMQEFGKASLMGFCPATCCKFSNITEGCPRSCNMQSN